MAAPEREPDEMSAYESSCNSGLPASRRGRLRRALGGLGGLRDRDCVGARNWARQDPGRAPRARRFVLEGAGSGAQPLEMRSNPRGARVASSANVREATMERSRRMTPPGPRR